MILKETRCSPGDAPEMVATFSQPYSTWLLTKEGGELEYNHKKFVENMSNECAAEKLTATATCSHLMNFIVD